MRKSFILLLVLTFALPSLAMVSSASSETSKPAVPELTVTFENGTSFHPGAYSIDPYTGKNVTISAPYYSQWANIRVIIENQPFTPYQDSNGTWIQLYYNVEAKGHYSDSWTTWAPGGSDPDNVEYMPQTANSNFTVVEYGAENYAPNSKIDFRVQAMIGYLKDAYSEPFLGEWPQTFIGETSDWSGTQTITIPYNITSESSDSPTNLSGSNSNSPTPATTPQQPNAQTGVLFGLDGEKIAIIGLIAAVVALVVITLFYRGRSLRQAEQP